PDSGRLGLASRPPLPHVHLTNLKSSSARHAPAVVPRQTWRKTLSLHILTDPCHQPSVCWTKVRGRQSTGRAARPRCARPTVREPAAPSGPLRAAESLLACAFRPPLSLLLCLRGGGCFPPTHPTSTRRTVHRALRMAPRG